MMKTREKFFLQIEFYERIERMLVSHNDRLIRSLRECDADFDLWMNHHESYCSVDDPKSFNDCIEAYATSLELDEDHIAHVQLTILLHKLACLNLGLNPEFSEFEVGLQALHLLEGHEIPVSLQPAIVDALRPLFGDPDSDRRLLYTQFIAPHVERFDQSFLTFFVNEVFR